MSKFFGGGVTPESLGIAPFLANYYVDPAFSGAIQTGSQSNPFKTIAAAFAFALALGLTGAVIHLPVRATITENVTFPDGTGRWEIRGESESPIGSGTILSGTINLNVSSGSSIRVLTNISGTGAITGNISGTTTTAILQTTNCSLPGAINLTTSTAVTWSVIMRGLAVAGVNAWGGATAGAVSIAGGLFTTNWSFTSSVTFSKQSFFDATIFNAGTIINASGVIDVYFLNACDWHAIPAFTVAGGGSVVAHLDPTSACRLLGRGTTTTGNISFQSINHQVGTNVPAATNNIALTDLSQGGAGLNTSLLVAEATITLLTPGTAGSAVLNVNYTDFTGVQRTKAVTPPLNIAGAAGDSVSGVLPFSQTGATGVKYSVTGIVTPGALVYRPEINVRVAA